MSNNRIIFAILSLVASAGYILLLATTHHRYLVLALSPIYAYAAYELSFWIITRRYRGRSL